jgi:hypothetical protein
MDMPEQGMKDLEIKMAVTYNLVTGCVVGTTCEGLTTTTPALITLIEVEIIPGQGKQIIQELTTAATIIVLAITVETTTVETTTVVTTTAATTTAATTTAATTTAATTTVINLSASNAVAQTARYETEWQESVIANHDSTKNRSCLVKLAPCRQLRQLAPLSLSATRGRVPCLDRACAH